MADTPHTDDSPWPKNRDDELYQSANHLTRLNKKFAKSDAIAGIETTSRFAPFNQLNDMFTRAFGIKLFGRKKPMHFFMATGWRQIRVRRRVFNNAI